MTDDSAMLLSVAIDERNEYKNRLLYAQSQIKMKDIHIEVLTDAIRGYVTRIAELEEHDSETNG